MAFGNRRPRQKMSLGNATSRRVERTRRGFGQRMHSRPMPAHIHFRAFTPEGELCGVAQCNDKFMVALFDANEKPLAPPTNPGVVDAELTQVPPRAEHGVGPA